MGSRAPLRPRLPRPTWQSSALSATPGPKEGPIAGPAVVNRIYGCLRGGNGSGSARGHRRQAHGASARGIAAPGAWGDKLTGDCPNLLDRFVELRGLTDDANMM